MTVYKLHIYKQQHHDDEGNYISSATQATLHVANSRNFFRLTIDPQVEFAIVSRDFDVTCPITDLSKSRHLQELHAWMGDKLRSKKTRHNDVLFMDKEYDVIKELGRA